MHATFPQAAEAKLKPGACIVADNAGVFAEGGLKPYLQYVRTSEKNPSLKAVSLSDLTCRFMMRWMELTCPWLQVPSIKALSLRVPWSKWAPVHMK